MSDRTLGGNSRFGFNGQEKTDEIAGKGNSYDFKFRGYDPRTGRFYSVDPLSKQYPWNSNYAFAENRVIDGIDLEGKEFESTHDLITEMIFGKTAVKIQKAARLGVDASVQGTIQFVRKDAWRAETWKQAGLFLEETALSSSPYSDIYKPNTPRLDASVKNINDNLIHGDAYSRTYFISNFVANVTTGYIAGQAISSLSFNAGLKAAPPLLLN